MQQSIPLADKISLKVGGAAEYFATVSTVSELAQAVRDAKDASLQINILSGGTNTLVAEGVINGLVLQPKILQEKKTVKNGETVFVTVSAGEDWDEVVQWMVDQEFWGLENLSLIPGWVGASPYQNIGAYGAEVADIIETVHTYDIQDEKEKIFTNKQCDFSYRNSFFKKLDEPRYVITAVTFRMQITPQPNINYRDVQEELGETEPTLQSIRKAIVDIRTRKMPDMKKYGTAGSFWMNPVIGQKKAKDLQRKFPEIPMYDVPGGKKIPLAWILDTVLHLKGYDKNNVSLYKHHPLVLITEKGATATDVQSLQKEIEKKVFDATGIKIEREVRFLQ
jgi:UDP-N-acetylmuramate dehydrogenase